MDGICAGSSHLNLDTQNENIFLSDLKLSLRLDNFEQKKKLPNESVEVQLYLPGSIIDNIV